MSRRYEVVTLAAMFIPAEDNESPEGDSRVRFTSPDGWRALQVLDVEEPLKGEPPDTGLVRVVLESEDSLS